jgi:uncharacterized protein (TIGR01777 family)
LSGFIVKRWGFRRNCLKPQHVLTENKRLIMSKNILIAGGSGLVGRRLQAILEKKGYQVRILTRSPKTPAEFAWDPSRNFIDPQALENMDAVVNLAGAGIADKPWTAARKRELIDSRVQSAAVLEQALQNTTNPPTAYISASAIGIYGNSGEIMMSETASPADSSFMVDCCQQWETAASRIASQGIRTVILRIGIVLSPDGGALAEVARPVRFGIGAYFGNGQAWWSWIHLDDLCDMIVWSVENEQASGIYNAVAPHPVRGKALVKAVARAMNRPAIPVPAPAFVLRAVLGEMSAVILNSNLVSADKVISAGFRFRFPEVQEALNDLYS